MMDKNDLERALAEKYKNGRRGLRWNDLAEDILPGYAPGRIDADSRARDELNGYLKDLECRGFLTLRKVKEEKAFTLYSLKFTEKMEDLCAAHGMQTRACVTDTILRALDGLSLSPGPVEDWRSGQLALLEAGKPDIRFWGKCSVDEIRGAVLMADAVIRNTEEVYVRDISKRVLGDSKGFTERIRAKTCGILEKCSGQEILDRLEDMRERIGKNASILSLYSVAAVPRYIPAEGSLEIETPCGRIVSDKMPYVFLSDSVGRYRSIRVKTPCFITIENRTTYEDFNEEGYTKFYVGGFPGYAERELLAEIYEENPGVRYAHWGDIDAGGFRIFSDVRRYLPSVVPYRMDIETLVRYREQTVPLTENDRKQLEKVEEGPFSEVTRYMLLHGIKLEQESAYA